MRRITLVFALVMSANLAGCTESNQRAQLLDPMLSASGFLVVLPDTPAKADELNSMTPLKMRYFSQGGKTHYWFADPVVCHCLFVGSEKAYQRYRQIKLREHMQKQAAETAMLNEDAAEQEQMNMTMWPVAPDFY